MMGPSTLKITSEPIKAHVSGLLCVLDLFDGSFGGNKQGVLGVAPESHLEATWKPLGSPRSDRHHTLPFLTTAPALSPSLNSE